MYKLAGVMGQKIRGKENRIKFSTFNNKGKG